MRWVLGIVLLVGAMAGCVGTDSTDSSAPGEGTNETTSGSCVSEGVEGRVTPTEPVTLDARMDDEPLTASIRLTSTGTGELNVSLARADETVWSTTEGGTGSVGIEDGFSTELPELPAGAYTLTVTGETAVRNLTAELVLATGAASC